MTQMSIFDLLQTADSPQAQDLQRWIASMFPKSNDRASFMLAIQLEQLFQMAVFENQLDTLHLLLQQGMPPDIRSDWGTTPLMWANCLGYEQIANLLIAYGADKFAKSFSGKIPEDFKSDTYKDLPEYVFIVNRRSQIHAQVTAGYLKPFGSATAPAGTSAQKKVSKRQRQIDNGKGVDEVFKKMEEDVSKTTRELNVVFE